ncbi:radical SAM protein [[Eubacterium] cellulosolvens]
MIRTKDEILSNSNLRYFIASIFETWPVSYLCRHFAKYLMEACPRCNKNRLDLIFENMNNTDSFLCINCKVNRLIIYKMIFYTFSSFFPEDEIKKLLQKSIYSRSIKAVLKGIANFGIKKPQPTGIPAVVVWNFTNKCNLNCLHCYQNSSPTSPDNEELSTKESLVIVDHLVDSGVVALDFSGGEPLLRPDFFEIAQQAIEAGMICSISTNGTLISEKTAKKLVEIGINGVTISIDSITPKIHDEFRRTPGSFQKAIEGIKNCATAGIQEIIVATTLTKFSLPELTQILELAKQLGATRYYVSRILPVGRGVQLEHLDVSPMELKNVLKWLSKRLYESVTLGEGIPCLARGMAYFTRQCYNHSGGTVIPVGEVLTGYELTNLKHFETRFADFLNRFADRFGACGAGITYCGLSPEGDVLPCAPATHIRLGNLKEQNLEDIWVNNEILQYLRQRDKIQGSCGQCKYKAICGGCRVTAYGKVGDWLGPDPSCPFHHSIS